ncbi:uncharacterized protein si:ch211-133n4.6 [Antennarius striatus]|uniref:uncharacterized protein si:ch211-133n4.6 n=1 Tax=Antennarius striatus TaxID=241820 RepID=UPI0035B3E6B2
MLTRNVVLLLSLFVLLVEGDMDANDTGIQTMSTDKDSTSDEAPTESLNAVSPDQPDEPQSQGAGPSESSSSSSEITDTAAANQVTAAEPPAANSAEQGDDKDEDESSDSEEVGRKKFSPRSTKPQTSNILPPNPAHNVKVPAHLPQSPALPAQVINPRPKVQVRSRAAKRRQRTNRRHI